MDYNIDEVIDIIKKQLPNEIETIPHIQQRYIERKIDINYVISCLIDKTPLDIAKTRHNRFKIIYPHETQITQDIYVIIEIGDNKIVKLITVYPKDKKRRENEKKIFWRRI